MPGRDRVSLETVVLVCGRTVDGFITRRMSSAAPWPGGIIGWRAIERYCSRRDVHAEQSSTPKLTNEPENNVVALLLYVRTAGVFCVERNFLYDHAVRTAPPLPH